jgi:hypothetical protein
MQEHNVLTKDDASNLNSENNTAIGSTNIVVENGVCGLVRDEIADAALLIDTGLVQEAGLMLNVAGFVLGTGLTVELARLLSTALSSLTGLTPGHEVDVTVDFSVYTVDVCVLEYTVVVVTIVVNKGTTSVLAVLFRHRIMRLSCASIIVVKKDFPIQKPGQALKPCKLTRLTY